MALTKSALDLLKARYEVEMRFAHGEPLQYRKCGDSEWRAATWSQWKWGIYEYRINPTPALTTVPLVCVMSVAGEVVWVAENNVDHLLTVGWRKITKFITKNGQRHAVVEG